MIVTIFQSLPYKNWGGESFKILRGRRRIIILMRTMRIMPMAMRRQKRIRMIARRRRKKKFIGMLRML